MSEKTFYENLNRLAHEQGLTISAVAKRANVQPSTLLRYVKRGPNASLRPSIRAAVAAALGKTVEDMESGAQTDRPVTTGAVALLAEKDIVSYFSEQEDDEPAQPSGLAYKDPASGTFVPAPAGSSPADDTDPGLIAFRVNSEALAPEIKPNDILFFHLYNAADDAFEIAPATAYALVLTDSGHVLVRKSIRGEQGERWFVATNPQWPGERQLDERCAKTIGLATGLYRSL